MDILGSFTSGMLIELLKITCESTPDAKIKKKAQEISKDLELLSDIESKVTAPLLSRIEDLLTLETAIFNSVSKMDVLLRQNNQLKYTDIKQLVQNIKKTNSDRKFSKPIVDYMSSLNNRIEYLTKEQYRMIRCLNEMSHVRVQGSAGSGKTLVASEKAIRLAESGLKTLFLCHNPLLAEYVKSLVLGSGVIVTSFSEWVADICGYKKDGQFDWNHYVEPDSSMIEEAFNLMESRPNLYDAIIVDEGQDFKSEWWILVELLIPENGTFYIFHDDDQALLPHRAEYPIKKPVVDISRNCRNAGKIFRMMQPFSQQQIEEDLFLEDLGEVLFHKSEANELDSLEILLNAFKPEQSESISLLTIEQDGDLISKIEGSRVCYSLHGFWQHALYDIFKSRLFRKGKDLIMPYCGIDTLEIMIDETFKKISNCLIPIDSDIILINQLASRFQVPPDIRHRLTHHPTFSNRIKWIEKDGQLHLSALGSSPIWPSEIVMFFENNKWVESLPRVREYTIATNKYDEINTIFLSDASSAKGLESDIVILILDGKIGNSWKKKFYVAISRARHKLGLLYREESYYHLMRLYNDDMLLQLGLDSQR